MTKWFYKILDKWLVKYLTAPSESRAKKTTNSPELLAWAIRPGDVLLVEGKERFSTAIKYLTQSNWSHAAIYIGPRGVNAKGETLDLLEADLKEGVRLIPLATYGEFHTRICRPRDLYPEDLERIIDFCFSRIGHSYDIQNILDLARYLLPHPLVPTKWRKKVLQFGSADPTQVICSSLIADAFQSIDYPILPLIETIEGSEVYKTLPASLFTPSDFDRSPYFEIIKPTYLRGFKYRELGWEKTKV